MADSLYIVATHENSGKSVVALGLMELLSRQIGSVGFFRPIVHRDPDEGSSKVDHHLRLVAEHFNLSIDQEATVGCEDVEAMRLLSEGRSGAVIEHILDRLQPLRERCDFVLCEGTDFHGASSVFEFDINAEIARNLGSPVLLVAPDHPERNGEMIQTVELALESLRDKQCEIIGVVVNRMKPDPERSILDALRDHPWARDRLVWGIAEEPTLSQPTVAQMVEALEAEVLTGQDRLDLPVRSAQVAAMNIPNFLERTQPGALTITPGDRVDIVIASLAAVLSASVGSIAGIVLTGGLRPDERIQQLIEGLPVRVPILAVPENTYPTAARVHAVAPVIEVGNTLKIGRAIEAFERNVDPEELLARVVSSHRQALTPKQFEHSLLKRAREQRRHIVLPEGEDERILEAAEYLLQRQAVTLTVLGRERRIRDWINRLGLKLDDLRIIDPRHSEHRNDLADTLFERRRHKGMTRDQAWDLVDDVSYFGTLMVEQGLADGMVSGATHATAATIRPAFEIIKTQPNVSLVSSVFLMCLSDRVLVFGDCAINPNPSAEQLAEIALASAATAREFGIEPVMALLSYSSGTSGEGADVDKVRRATRIAQERAADTWPELSIDGPLQYDTAVDPGVARSKLPDSPVAGQATVLIFPDLNTGNNTYKAVQRSSGAMAIGPVLQGLRKPVNDLSRGCTVVDVVNTIAITAIQAALSDT